MGSKQIDIGQAITTSNADQFFEICEVDWIKRVCTKAGVSFADGKRYMLTTSAGDFLVPDWNAKTAADVVVAAYGSASSIYASEQGYAAIAGADDEKGVCKPAETMCKSVWAGTAGAVAQGETDSLNVCKYDASGTTNADTRPGCCGGFTNMSTFEHPLTTNRVPNGKQTACWAHNGGVPGADALETTNYKVQQTYTAGDVIDLSWVSTANHGGMWEYSIVCDGDETYDNFRKNRLKFVDGGSIYKDKTFTETIHDNIISNDNEWSFTPQSMPNAAFHSRVQLPRDLHGDKCTLGWFWWGMNSNGTFIACADIKILASGSGPEPTKCKTSDPNCSTCDASEVHLTGHPLWGQNLDVPGAFFVSHPGVLYEPYRARIAS